MIMNNLEFIENIIKRGKEILKDIDKQIQENQNYPSLLEFHIREKERIEKEIVNFEQIKAKLEAWEICKRHLILDKEFHQIDLHLHHDTKYKEDYLKLKKALEVKDNVD